MLLTDPSCVNKKIPRKPRPDRFIAAKSKVDRFKSAIKIMIEVNEEYCLENIVCLESL